MTDCVCCAQGCPKGGAVGREGDRWCRQCQKDGCPKPQLSPVLKPQLWYCECCGVLGATMYKERQDVMSVVHAMGEQHRTASPECENGAYGLRSLVVENIKEPLILRPHDISKR